MINNIINDIAKKAAETQNEDPPMYQGEDGFMYCSNCHTLRQCEVMIFGTKKKQYCLCECMIEREETKRLQVKTDMTNIEIQKARQLAKNDPAFRTHTFANDNGQHPELMRKAKKYATDFERHLKSASGLLLFGPKGTGKSYAAEAIANKVIDSGYPVIFTTFGKIAETANEAGYEGRGEYFQSLTRCPLLIIDDVGMERETDYMMEIMQRVIDDRNRSLKPMIITTNFTSDEINHPKTSEWERIWSRIMHTCYPIRCDGDDIRAVSGIQRNKEMKKYFERE